MDDIVLGRIVSMKTGRYRFRIWAHDSLDRKPNSPPAFYYRIYHQVPGEQESAIKYGRWDPREKNKYPKIFDDGGTREYLYDKFEAERAGKIFNRMVKQLKREIWGIRHPKFIMCLGFLIIIYYISLVGFFLIEDFRWIRVLINGW